MRESARRLGAHRHPEITLSILPMGDVLDAYDRGELAAVNAHLGRTCRRLADAGCDFYVCPDNTAHVAIDAATAPYPIPGLHIADIVARQAQADGRRRVALLGTRWTMEGPAYPAAFARAGVGLADSRSRRNAPTIDRIIFEELCQGVVEDDSRGGTLRIIGRMKGEGCDAVALACTEIPLLVTPDASSLPVLDSTRLLARAAAAKALGDSVSAGGPS